MSSEENKRLVRRFYEEIDLGNLGAMDELAARGVHEGDLPGIPATGNALTMTGTVIHRIENGKLAEKWSDKDLHGLLTQLGVLPPLGAAPE